MSLTETADALRPFVDYEREGIKPADALLDMAERLAEELLGYADSIDPRGRSRND